MKTYRSLHANNYGYSTALEINVSITATKNQKTILGRVWDIAQH